MPKSRPRPIAFGSWLLRLEVRGAFGPISPEEGGDLDALQACGAEETSIRVVRIDPAGSVVGVSRAFAAAALLASDLVSVGSHVFLVAARLDPSAGWLAPYSMTAYELTSSTMSVVAERPLGRGNGAHLAVGLVNGRTQVLCATGSTLFALGTTPNGAEGSARPGIIPAERILDTSPAVITHIATAVEKQASALSGRAAAGETAPFVLSTLFPGASSVRPSAELLVIASGGRRVEKPLPAGESVQSLAAGGERVFYATGRFSTEIYSSRLSDLGGTYRVSPPKGEALDEVGLSTSGRVLLAYSTSSVACIDTRSGRVVATQSATAAGSGGSVVAVARSASTTWVEDALGIAELATPAACG